MVKVCGKGKGLVGQIFKACDESKCSKPLIIHCILFTSRLFVGNTSICYTSCVTEPVMSAVSFIRSRGLKHRNLSLEIEAEYSDLPYHTPVRWLSNGKVLLRFFDLREVIEIFLNEKNCPQPLLSMNLT